MHMVGASAKWEAAPHRHEHAGIRGAGWARLIACLGTLCILRTASACTSLVASNGATVDGTLVAYNADDYDHYGALQHFPAALHAPGTMRQVYDVDSRAHLGEIPEANATFNVVRRAPITERPASFLCCCC